MRECLELLVEPLSFFSMRRCNTVAAFIVNDDAKIHTSFSFLQIFFSNLKTFFFIKIFIW